MSPDDSAPEGSGTDGIACTLTETEREERRETIRTGLFPHLRDLEVAPERVAMRFDDDGLERVTEYLRLEHACCSFLAFDLHVTPGEAPIELAMTGEGLETAFEEGLEPMVEAYDPALLA